MGTWEVRPFEDDNALDWFDELCEAEEPHSMISEALHGVTEGSDRSLGTCSLALAAAELVAVASGNPGMATPPEALNFAGLVSLSSEMNQLALTVISEIEAKSDLTDEYAQQGLMTEWLAALADLRSRLASKQRAITFQAREPQLEVARKGVLKRPVDESVVDFETGVAIYDEHILSIDPRIQKTSTAELAEWRLGDMAVRLQPLSNQRHKFTFRVGRDTHTCTDKNKRRYFEGEVQILRDAFRRRSSSL